MAETMARSLGEVTMPSTKLRSTLRWVTGKRRRYVSEE